jgi:hypothetical protein
MKTQCMCSCEKTRESTRRDALSQAGVEMSPCPVGIVQDFEFRPAGQCQPTHRALAIILEHGLMRGTSLPGRGQWFPLRDMGIGSRSHSRPAMARGIHSADLRNCAVDRLDSRFRGNDRRSERDPIPNPINTGQRMVLGRTPCAAAATSFSSTCPGRLAYLLATNRRRPVRALPWPPAKAKGLTMVLTTLGLSWLVALMALARRAHVWPWNRNRFSRPASSSK